jgi:adenylate kinase
VCILISRSHRYQATKRRIRIYRNYQLKKIQENNEAEIMQVVLDEAKSSYAPEIVVELRSEDMGDLEENISRIVEWIKAWQR